MAKPRSNLEPVLPEHILTGHSIGVRTIAEALRALIRTTAPQAVKTARSSWHSINYTHPSAGYFCAIVPFIHQALALPPTRAERQWLLQSKRGSS